LRREELRPIVLHSHLRACLDARRDADDVLRDALSAKKLKELRRQRNRLAEHGAVRFEVARSVEEVATAIEVFLALEASGWKAKRGTALKQDEGDAGFIRIATRGLAETGQCEVVTMHAGKTPVAAAVVLRHQDRAFYFKLGIDENFAKFSPGVQLTLDLTRHLCADAVLATADSTASANHPMINPIWRGRLKIGDVVIPLRPRDPVVSLIHGAMAARHGLREVARRAVHRLRGEA
jgi:CelD/BcsL family acetyltransferase involved in cellulose biosynthesis